MAGSLLCRAVAGTLLRRVWWACRLLGCACLPACSRGLAGAAWLDPHLNSPLRHTCPQARDCRGEGAAAGDRQPAGGGPRSASLLHLLLGRSRAGLQGAQREPAGQGRQHSRPGSTISALLLASCCWSSPWRPSAVLPPAPSSVWRRAWQTLHTCYACLTSCSPCPALCSSLAAFQIRVEAGEADAEYDDGEEEAEGEGEEEAAPSSKTVAQALEEAEGRLQVRACGAGCGGLGLFVCGRTPGGRGGSRQARVGRRCSGPLVLTWPRPPVPSSWLSTAEAAAGAGCQGQVCTGGQCAGGQVGGNSRGCGREGWSPVLLPGCRVGQSSS